MMNSQQYTREPPGISDGVTERLSVTTSNDNEQCPTTQTHEQYHVADSEDSGPNDSSSRHQENTILDLSKKSFSRLGDSTAMESDRGATRHDQATLSEPQGKTDPAEPCSSSDMDIFPSSVGEIQSDFGFIPMPPVPIHIPLLSSVSPSGRRFTWHEALEHNSSLLDDAGLFKAFQLRRKEHQCTVAPNLIRAMAEYLGEIEERLTSSHQHLPRPAAPTKHAQEAKLLKNKETAIPAVRSDQKKAPMPADNFNTEVLPEMQFYHSDDGFDFMNENRNPHYHDYHSSARDPNYLIRVNFQWKVAAASSGRTPLTEDIPDPNDIDVLSFMVSSRPLAKFFERRLGVQERTFRLEKSSLPILMLSKPFRAVITNYSRLKDQLTILTKKYGPGMGIHETGCHRFSSDFQSSSEQGVPNIAASSESETKSELFDQQMALEHFQLLVRFIELYLGEKVVLFESYRAGRANMITYENLWMLFCSGEKICCPVRETQTKFRKFDLNGMSEVKIVDNDGDNDDKDDNDNSFYYVTRRRYLPQAYRVMTAGGGAPLILDSARNTSHVTEDRPTGNNFSRFRSGGYLEPRVLSKPSWLQRTTQNLSPLRVHALHVDFDGVNYGIVTEVFAFNPFDGEMYIRSLEAYPLRYYTDPGSSDLVQRGRKFIDVAASLHQMDHVGMTVGETKEECNSPVVVDLKLAFTEYQQAFPPRDSVVPKFPPLPEISLLNIQHASDLFIHSHSAACLGISHCFKRDRDAYAHSLDDQMMSAWQSAKRQLETLPRSYRECNRSQKLMEHEDLIELLPGSVPGFSLRNRKWVQVNLDQLHYIEKQDNWNNLALPSGHRDIVQAMVEMHTVGSNNNSLEATKDSFEMDLVRGKGNGCIILLHGVPGVGKTSTAECVASYTQRPLYSITCGDVGYEPEDVERYMEKHFKLANKLGCVLLLDEADVFLAKRDKSDVKRNGLVSVFLRILEYYPGILFLTTNRVGAIDDAFRSRLHLTLYYPKLTESRTVKVWKTNFQRMRENNKILKDQGRLPIEFNDKKIMAWVKKHWQEIQWNGRQIRNAFQAAVALAEFEARQRDVQRDVSSSKKSPVLTTDHFKKLARASSQFSEYLRETHGDDEDERAGRENMRAMPSRTKVRRSLVHDDEDESDAFSDSASCSESSDASGSDSLFGSGTENSDVGKKPKKKGKQTDEGRSHSSRKDKKAKGREDR